MTTTCFDRDGAPIDVAEWAILLDSNVYRRVSLTTIGDDDAVNVSTVWVGIDQGLGLDDAPPMIFETKVFGGEHDDERWLWATEKHARNGHDDVVRYVLGKGDAP